VSRHPPVVVIDLPEDLFLGMLERAEVPLSVRVVVFGEVLECQNLLEDLRLIGRLALRSPRSCLWSLLFSFVLAVAHATAASLSGGERGRRSRAGRRGGESPGCTDPGHLIRGRKLGMPRRPRLRLALDRLGRQAPACLPSREGSSPDGRNEVRGARATRARPEGTRPVSSKQSFRLMRCL
jgi:hypothetical protein